MRIPLILVYPMKKTRSISNFIDLRQGSYIIFWFANILELALPSHQSWLLQIVQLLLIFLMDNPPHDLSCNLPLSSGSLFGALNVCLWLFENIAPSLEASKC